MGSFTAHPLAAAPILDGNLKEWGRAAWHNISGGEYVEKGARSGTKDAGVRWAARWDDQWLYLAVRLEDNEWVNGEIGDTLWKDDCVEVYVNPNGTDFNWGDSDGVSVGFFSAFKRGESRPLGVVSAARPHGRRNENSMGAPRG
jgi:hypothetical protein